MSTRTPANTPDGRRSRARRPASHAAIAIILARSGSKGLPGKNAALVAGVPCLRHSIDAARASRHVALVAVSTDGATLRAIALEGGAIVLPRPARLAGDRATVDDAARHALLTLETQLGAPLNAAHPIVILYGNVPVRPCDLIDRAVDRLMTGRADSVQSYAPVGKYHPWWTARVNERSGAVRPWEGRVLNHGVFRRQDLPPAYIPDGGVIALTRRALLLQIKDAPPGPHAFFGKRRLGVINPEGSVIDIDSAADLHAAEATLAQRAKSTGAATTAVRGDTPRPR